MLAAVAVVLLVFACSDEPSAPVGPATFEIPNILASLTPTQVAKLTASDAAASDRFGNAVALSGDVAVVGARGDDDAGDRSGSTYVFRYGGGGWSQEAKLTASDAATLDQFGDAVALSGDVALVGAPFDDDAGEASGSAYVFRYGGGGWSQEAKLTASDAGALDQFGDAVALVGDVALVGAFLDDDAGVSSGSAYVFRNMGGAVWTQEAKLTASDAAATSGFGSSVALSGDVAVVGAPADDDAGIQSGSAYVFRNMGGAVWTQEAKLTASDAAVGDLFGEAVALSGDVAVVGAWGDDDAGEASGSAYVFRYGGGGWSQEAKLTASDAGALDQFGDAVALSGDVAVVGAWGDDDADDRSGSAYVFRYGGGGWSQEAKLTASDAAAADEFGWSVAVNSDVAVVGAVNDDVAGDRSGSAYVFQLLDDPEAVIDHVIDEVEILAAGSSSTLAEELEDAASRLETARDALAETPPDYGTALRALEQAVDLLEAAVSDGLLDPVQGAALMDRLAGVARDIAVAAIDDAIARGGDPDRIDEAEAELGEGDTLRASGHFTDAVDKYKDAFVSADSSLEGRSRGGVSRKP